MNKKLNNLLTSLFLMGVAIALLNYLGVISWLLNLAMVYKVLIGVVGFIVVTVLIKYRKELK